MTTENQQNKEVLKPYQIIRQEFGGYADIRAITLNQDNKLTFHRETVDLSSAQRAVSLEKVENALSAPAYVYFDPSLRCPLSCEHCLSRSGANNVPSLNHDETLNIAEQIIRAGVLRVKIGGGEPLVFSQIYELIAELRKHRIATDIATSGVNLAILDQSIMELFKEHKVTLSVSIDGYPNYHNQFRGPGVFEKALAGIERLRDQGIAHKIRATICNTPASISQVQYLVDLSKQTGTPLKIKLARPVGRAAGNGLAFTQADSDYWQLFDLLREIVNTNSLVTVGEEIIRYDVPDSQLVIRTGLDCGAGTRAGQIDACGNFSPCAFLTPYYPGHNLLTDPNKDLLHYWREGEDFLKIRQFFKTENTRTDTPCPTCGNRHACQGGCPSVRLSTEAALDPRCALKRPPNISIAQKSTPSETRVNGGNINHIQLSSDSIVRKQYANESMIGVPSEQRALRELRALKRFNMDSVPVPKVLNFNTQEHWLEMEQIIGFPLDEYVRTCSLLKKTEVLQQAGALLKKIHCPVTTNTDYYLDQFFKKTQTAAQTTAPILNYANLCQQQILELIDNNLDLAITRQFGITRVHRDFWLNNLLYNGKSIVGVIDWELAGIGSPFEDFAIVNLWIERVHQNTEAFWQGYGEEPDRATTMAWLMGRCLQFLSTATLEQYQAENPTGFYHNKIMVIKQILEELK